jgi:hypothetical protein
MTKNDWDKTKEVIDKLMELNPDEFYLCNGKDVPYSVWYPSGANYKRVGIISFFFDTDFEDAWLGAWIEVEKWNYEDNENILHETMDKTTYSFEDIEEAFKKLKELLGG